MTYNDLLKMLQEQHEAMANVMMLRRQSTRIEQRQMASEAIEVWRKVDAFLSAISVECAVRGGL